MNYENFDLEITQHNVSGRDESFAVRVLDSPAGQQKASAAVQVALHPETRARVRTLDRRGMDRQKLIELGSALGEALFPPPIRSLYEASRTHLGPSKGLRIRLRFDQLALTNLPWEYVYLTRHEGSVHSLEGFLGLDRQISIVRYELMNQPPPQPLPLNERLRFVGIFASPTTLEPLRVEHERRLLERALSTMPALEVETHARAGVDALLDAFTQPAHVLHFAGHGIFDPGASAGKGYLVLEDDQRRPVPLSAERLALSLQSRGLRLAVLSACQTGTRDQTHPWTGVAPALVRAGIPAVIGMQFRIFDESTIAFTRHFYHALLRGQTIDAAVTAGRLAILARTGEDDRDWGVPVLYMRTGDGVIFTAAPQNPDLAAFDPDLPAVRRLGAGRAVRSMSRQNLQKDNADIAPLPTSSVELHQLKIRLRDVLHGKFTTTELQLLAHDLGVDFDEIAGQTRLMKSLSLVEHLSRRDRLAQLLTVVRHMRPGAI
jgi:hypothetical protein